MRVNVREEALPLKLLKRNKRFKQYFRTKIYIANMENLSILIEITWHQ